MNKKKITLLAIGFAVLLLLLTLTTSVSVISVPKDHQDIVDNFRLVDRGFSKDLKPSFVDSWENPQMNLRRLQAVTPNKPYKGSLWIWYSYNEDGSHKDPNACLELWGPLDDGSYQGMISKLMENDLEVSYNFLQEVTLGLGESYVFYEANGEIVNGWVSGK